MKKTSIYVFVSSLFLLGTSCEKEKNLQGDFVAPPNMPAELVTGTPLGDAIQQMFDDYGVIIYTDPTLRRFSADLVSNESLRITDRQPADTAAALFAIKMLRNEFYDVLPPDKKSFMPRNFYFLKNRLLDGTGASQNHYHSYLWSNSVSDLTIGGLDNTALDTVYLKGSLFYGLSGILRKAPQWASYYNNFMSIQTNAGTYYWQVNSLATGHEAGFVTGSQSEIMSNALDFDLYASWGATVDPHYRDSLFAARPLIANKYAQVSGVFRAAGIPLEEVNNSWQASALNPKNN